MDKLPWKRVEQYLIELAIRDGQDVVRHQKEIPEENELLELMRDLQEFRREDIKKQQSNNNEQESISNSINTDSSSDKES